MPDQPIGPHENQDKECVLQVDIQIGVVMALVLLRVFEMGRLFLIEDRLDAAAEVKACLVHCHAIASDDWAGGGP